MLIRVPYKNVREEKTLFDCLFIDGPISGPTSWTQNAGAERLCSVQLRRGPVWLDFAVRLDASLRLGVAASWEMKVVPIRCLAAFDSVPGFFSSPEVHRHQQ